MSELNFGKTITLKQASQMILATPQNRYLLQGEPGIGKSSLLKTLGASLPSHEIAYIDVPNMDLGDIAMPVINHETKTTAYYPNTRFKVHTGKPVITMLDEFTKGAEPVKNMLLPLLEVANPRLGDVSVHPDSIIFLTGNLGTDGVGDTLKAHSRNRIIPLTISKPDADQWIEWAINNDIAPEVIAWVKQFPHALASYTDPSQRENPYIFNPTRAGMGAVVTPRSLEKASHIAKRRAELGDALTINLLTGTIGESASRDMQAFFTVVDKLPTWEQILANPTGAKMPDDAVARCILVFSAISRVDKETLSKWLTYSKRMDMEWQALFATSVMKSPKQSFCVMNSDFKDWALKNQWLF